MLNCLDGTPKWFQPLQDKLGYLNDSNPNLLWDGIKSMTYSFTITMVITKGNYVEGLKSAGIAALAEIILVLPKLLAGTLQEQGSPIPPAIQNYGFRIYSFGMTYLTCKESKIPIDVKASAIATIIPLIFAKILKAPGLNVFGMVRV